ncbi:G patch domain-containing protein 4-like [Anneissia japonica]|uniref:G patch domain-containing protein 4-like n=1 Tax=Anneissia japonica TaxID=1529436 RepID=UPI0014258ACD|nr:G patch domain-containing protein 4-like [Anneissia japonica]
MAAYMRGSMSEFAEKHMKRHGWKAGSGLGRNEDGISEAIKVKIKRDSAGVGHDPAEQFTFHWWDHVFNKAASNIQVTNNEDGVVVLNKKEGSHMITNEKPVKSSNKKNTLYGMFVKSATLTPAGEQSVSSSSEEEEDVKIDFSSGLADDELFKACGGRTAHKGARHGLKSNGKLQRLQEQERLLKTKKDAKNEPVDVRAKDVARKKKKKKKKKCEDDGNIEDPIDNMKIGKKVKEKKSEEIENIDDPIDGVWTKKKKRKKEKSQDIEKKRKRKNTMTIGESIEGSILSNILEECEDIADPAEDLPGVGEEESVVRKRKKKTHNRDINNERENDENVLQKSRKRNKEKRLSPSKQSSSKDEVNGIVLHENDIISKKVKKKKKKRKDICE